MAGEAETAMMSSSASKSTKVIITQTASNRFTNTAPTRMIESAPNTSSKTSPAETSSLTMSNTRSRGASNAGKVPSDSQSKTYPVTITTKQLPSIPTTENSSVFKYASIPIIARQAFPRQASSSSSILSLDSTASTPSSSSSIPSLSGSSSIFSIFSSYPGSFDSIPASSWSEDSVYSSPFASERPPSSSFIPLSSPFVPTINVKSQEEWLWLKQRVHIVNEYPEQQPRRQDDMDSSNADEPSVATLTEIFKEDPAQGFQDVSETISDDKQTERSPTTSTVISIGETKKYCPQTAAVSETCRLPFAISTIGSDPELVVVSIPSASSTMNRQTFECRYCYETVVNPKPPCGCKGSAGYVHGDCLLHWAKLSKRTNCEICHQEFTSDIIRQIIGPPRRLIPQQGHQQLRFRRPQQHGNRCSCCRVSRGWVLGLSLLALFFVSLSVFGLSAGLLERAGFVDKIGFLSVIIAGVVVSIVAVWFAICIFFIRCWSPRVQDEAERRRRVVEASRY